MQKEERLDYLDGLKGLFTILVVLGHFNMMFNKSGFVGWGTTYVDPKSVFFENLPWSLFINNTLPLYLFMALIAFFPAYKYFKKKDNKSLIRSSILRYFRFVPMVFVGCLISYLLYRFELYCFDDYINLTGNMWVSQNASYSFTFLDVFKDGLLLGYLRGTQMISSLWCLNYLFLGSLLSYVFVYIVGNVKHRGWVYLGIAMIFLVIDPTYLSFISGVGVADMVCNSELVNNKKVMILFFIVGIIIGLCPEVLMPSWLNILVVEAISEFFILTGIAGLFSKSKFLNNKLLTNIGKMSFALIIVHILVLFTVAGYIYIWLNGLNVPSTINFVITFISFAIISLIASDIYNKVLTSLTGKICFKVIEALKL